MNSNLWTVLVIIFCLGCGGEAKVDKETGEEKASKLRMMKLKQASAPEKDESKETFYGHDGQIWGVAWNPDGTRLASAGQDGIVNVWDAATGEVVKSMKGHSDAVWGVSWSADGKLLASASQDHSVKVWDIAAGKARHTHAFALPAPT